MNLSLQQLTPRTRLIAIIGVLFVFAVIIFILVFNGATYVRIVDRASTTNTDTDAPGADINAVEIKKTAKGTSIYANEIISSQLNETEGVTNAHTTPDDALGAPDKETPAQSVSLGNGGELVVKVPTRLKKSDTVIVYEIGQSTGPRAERYEVYTSTSANGPWELRGEGAGIYGIVIDQP